MHVIEDEDRGRWRAMASNVFRMAQNISSGRRRGVVDTEQRANDRRDAFRFGLWPESSCRRATTACGSDSAIPAPCRMASATGQ